MEQRVQIKDANVLIVGLARNCEDIIESEMRNIHSAFVNFKERSWIIVESDSDDSTVSKLTTLTKEFDLNLISMGRLRDKFPKRTQRISECRNEYVKKIMNEANYAKIDFVVVADLDGVNRNLNPRSVQACWNVDVEWDACFANQSAPYYDIWALRHEIWSPNDCWKNVEFLEAHKVKKTKAYYNAVYARMITIEENEKPIEVDSAFGGLGIYKRQLFEGCEYSGLNSDGEEFCEHVSIHAMMKKKGAKLLIVPSFINGGWNEHSMHLKTFIVKKSAIKSKILKLFGKFS